MIAIFASDTGLDMLTRARRIAVDGTFKTTPTPFAQLFAIQVPVLFFFILSFFPGYKYRVK